MRHEGLTEMAKIEVIVRGEDVGVVTDLFVAAGVTGYTSVAPVSGMGHHGHHQGRLMFNESAGLTMLITVVPHARTGEIVAALRELFTNHSGVVFISDTYVSRPEYFTHY